MQCSCYWRLVFADYYGEPPQGNDDARWDPLFKIGFPVLRTLEELDGSPP